MSWSIVSNAAERSKYPKYFSAFLNTRKYVYNTWSGQMDGEVQYYGIKYYKVKLALQQVGTCLNTEF